MLSNLALRPFKRTTALGTQTGLQITWDSDVTDEEVFISYNLARAGFVLTPGQLSPPWELIPAEPGEYEFHVVTHAQGRDVFDYGFHKFTFDGLPPADEDIPRPSGLELVGVDGELLGSARTFTGRDLRLRWNSLRVDALQTEGVGEQSADQLLEHAIIRVYDANDDLLRKEIQPISLTEWVYTYAHATEDIPLTADPASVARTLRLEVSFTDTAGRESTASLLNIVWTLRLTATADIDVAGTKEFASFTKSSSFAVLDADDETETYGPATAVVFDDNSVVRALIRINFDLRADFPSDSNSSTKNQVIFEVLRRPSGGADIVLDTFNYDMHITYPSFGTTRGRISIPSFSVNDTPGDGTFEYRVHAANPRVPGRAPEPRSRPIEEVAPWDTRRG
jgi:hypothetical protein